VDDALVVLVGDVLQQERQPCEQRALVLRGSNHVLDTLRILASLVDAPWIGEHGQIDRWPVDGIGQRVPKDFARTKARQRRQQRADRCIAQALQRIVRARIACAAGILGQTHAGGLGHAKRRRMQRSRHTLCNGTLKVLGCKVEAQRQISLVPEAGHQPNHADGTGTLAKDCDLLGISAERADESVGPLEAGNLIQQAKVAWCRRRLYNAIRVTTGAITPGLLSTTVVATSGGIGIGIGSNILVPTVQDEPGSPARPGDNSSTPE
jgi:hypothetical protein